MAEHLHGVSSGSSSAQPQHPSGRTAVRMRWILSLVVLLGGVMVLLLIVRGNGVAESEIVDDGRVHTIQLDVLNATGETKLAQKMTDYLRSRGFDVVELGNHRGGLEKTLVIDRTGNTQAAVQVAEVLGVPKEQVVQKIDKTLYLDVSVYIGNDYRALRPFR